MALIKNEHNLFISQVSKLVLKVRLVDRIIQFLNCGENELCIISQLPHQRSRILGHINTVLLKRIELLHRLVVQVLAVDDKDNLMNSWQIHYDLTGLK